MGITKCKSAAPWTCSVIYSWFLVFTNIDTRRKSALGKLWGNFFWLIWRTKALTHNFTKRVINEAHWVQVVHWFSWRVPIILQLTEANHNLTTFTQRKSISNSTYTFRFIYLMILNSLRQCRQSFISKRLNK